jgi:hypothetical protein
MAAMREKLGGNLRIGQPMCYGSGWESFFSGAVDLFYFVDKYA